MSELTRRIIFAIPAAAIFLYLTWLGGWFFKITVLLIGFFVIHETIRLFKKSDLRPDVFFPYSFGLWIMLIPDLPHTFQLGLAIFLLFIALQVARPSETAVRSIGSTLFCGIYAPLGLLSFILVRQFAAGEQGFMLALSLLLMVWGNDVFAYFGGRSFGKHLMAPAISPKKTWEGFASGFLGALTGLLIAAYLIPLGLPVTFIEIFPAVILVSLAGPVGDLTASKIKRASMVKDTSNILPGHGGFFDRFDALILAAPVFYLYLYCLKIFKFFS